jgi:DNA-binding NtrC family response regulator
MPASTKARILIVDDDKTIRWSLTTRLKEEGYDIDEAADAKTARNALSANQYDLLLLDYRLPDGNGFDVLKHAKTIDPSQLAIFMTTFATVKNATESMRLGAYDYIDKPFDLDELVLTIEKALETLRLRTVLQRTEQNQRSEFGIDNLIGQAPASAELRRLVVKIAKSVASSVLITGESGTGKGLVARAIHYEGPGADQPFMNITCTALPETLLETELFGHEKGAFTDARLAKKGLFELADGGTVFLDEIGDLPLSLQSKLLRFLEDKTFRRLGGTKDTRVDVRIIAATNKNLQAAAKAGTFRLDLYYRLNVVPVEVPPLRERKEDVAELVKHFLRKYAVDFGKRIDGFEPETIKRLEAYPWPGNIRELRNVIERAVLLAETETLSDLDLPPEIRSFGEASTAKPNQHYFTLPAAGVDIEAVEHDLLLQALERARGNKTRAGKLLNLKRDAIRYWMKKFHIADDEGSAEKQATEVDPESSASV